MQFSNLANQISTQFNSLYSEYEKAKSTKRPIIDLISGDFFQSEIGFPADHLQSILRESIDQIKKYKSDPLGQYLSREVIAEYSRSFEINISPDQILLTPGTSCSYFYCLKLLVNPGRKYFVQDLPIPCLRLLLKFVRLNYATICLMNPKIGL